MDDFLSLLATYYFLSTQMSGCGERASPPPITAVRRTILPLVVVIGNLADT